MARARTVRRVVIMGAGGRDFHDFNVVYRDDPAYQVVAFTAAQIPGIAGRRYPASLAGAHYPDGIPIHAEGELAELIARERVDEVVLAYSDLSHEDVMHKASLVLASGADFTLLGPHATMLRSTRPVVAVTAVRTGSGKSQTSRRVARILRTHGLAAALVRHPMPYGDLEAMRVQRFATQADIDAADPTLEEREEYERPVAEGTVVYAGVDYAAILARAAEEAQMIVWDSGNYVAARAARGDVVEILPAMGYGDEQLQELAERIDATDCDVVVTGTPIDLGRLVDVRHPIRHATYELEEVGSPTLEDVLAPVIELAAKR